MRRLMIAAAAAAFAAVLVWLAVAPGAPSVIAKSSSISELWFAQAYDLDENEVVRFCPPPYPVARYAMVSWLIPAAPPERSGELLLHAGRTKRYWLGSTRIATLGSSLAHVNEISPVEWDVPEDLAELPTIGDWVMRTEAPREQRVAALQSILRQILNRSIVIEKRRMLRPAIIVTGSYSFKSLGRGRQPQEVQLFVALLDPQEGSGGGTGTFASFITRLEHITARRVVDQTTSTPDKIVWSNNRDCHTATSDRNRLLSLLANVTLQTGLRFELAERDVDVYCVREGTAATSAATTRSEP